LYMCCSEENTFGWKLYKKYLGIDVPNNKMGILQDVHWSHGSFGYFPTYSLGSFYAAQFFETAKTQIPNLENHIASGNFNLLFPKRKVYLLLAFKSHTK
jgi:Zn-dependent M32 family carboxypeptidase